MPGFTPSIPSIPIIAPAREWTMSDADLIDYARARRLPVHVPGRRDCRIDQNLWGRVARVGGRRGASRPLARASREGPRE